MEWNEMKCYDEVVCDVMLLLLIKMSVVGLVKYVSGNVSVSAISSAAGTVSTDPKIGPSYK
jgi:hypothetical protein